MAARRRNNHYHYAEKFERDRKRRRKLALPRRTVFLAVLFMVVLGVVSTTFAAYLGSDESAVEGRTIIVDIRTAKANQDLVATGATADLARTGGYYNGYIYWVDTVSWGACNLYMWNGSWNTNWDMTQISGTNIYYHSFDSQYGFEGFKFRSDTSWTHQSSGNITVEEGTGGRWVNGTETTVNSDTGMMNSKAMITTMISYDNGANYTETANANIYTSIALEEFNYATSKYQTTSRTGNTSEHSTYTHYPAYGSNYTLTAHYPSGVEFRGFTTSSTSKPTAAAGSDTATYTASHLNNGEEHYYAYYVVPTVTDSAILPANIAASTVKPSISYASDTQYSKVTLTAPTISAYSFSSWTFSGSGTQTYLENTTSQSSTAKLRTSANTTATANYSLKAPSSVSITGGFETTVGAAAVSLSPVVTTESKAQNATVTLTQNKSYTIKNANGTVISSGATVDSTGKFSATVPGVYTITMSVYNSDSNGLTSSTTTSSPVTVTVKPAKPSWTLTMSGYDANGSNGNGTTYGSSTNPYLVHLGSSFSFTASIDSALSGYTYTWYNGDDEVIGTGSPLTFGADTASQATLADVHIEVYCVVSYTDVNGSTLTTTADGLDCYYFIKSLINTFEIPSLQKIYANPNSAHMRILYNIPNASDYTTKLFASSDNKTYFEAVVSAVGSFLGTLVTGSDPAEYTFTPSQLYTNGPKWFFLEMSKTGASAKTDPIHTTIGAESSTGSRSIYFINNTGLDISNYRVMAFYVDSNGDLYYQTAQDVFKGRNGSGISAENKRFRVTIPEDATYIAFAVAKKGKYSIPTYSNGTLSFGNNASDFYFAIPASMTTLTADKNTVTANTSPTLISTDYYRFNVSYIVTQTTA